MRPDLGIQASSGKTERIALATGAIRTRGVLFDIAETPQQQYALVNYLVRCDNSDVAPNRVRSHVLELIRSDREEATGADGERLLALDRLLTRVLNLTVRGFYEQVRRLVRNTTIGGKR